MEAESQAVPLLRTPRSRLPRTLVLIYLGGVVLRFVLGLLFSQNPFIMPDEALYANLARAFLSGGPLSLRNQPVTFTNLLYSLLISPAYLIGAPGAQFRLIQLFNAFAMNAAVFPVYYLVRRVVGRTRTVYLLCAAALALPDFVLTTRIMSESIVYPLFFLTVHLMFRYMEDTEERKPDLLWIAVSAFLLSQAKSGMVSLTLAFIGYLGYRLVVPLLRRNRESLPPKAWKQPLIDLLSFAGLFLLLTMMLRFILQYWLGMDFSVASIYVTQTQQPTLLHLKQTLPGLLLYAFFVPVSFGVFPLLLPVGDLKAYDATRRRQIVLAASALALTAIGACYMFFDTETIGTFYAGRVHLRYVFMYLPLFLVFLAAPVRRPLRLNGGTVGYLLFLLAMTVTVTTGALLSNRRYPVDAISLSWIVFDDPALELKKLAQVALIVFVGGMAFLIRREWDRKARTVLTVCLGLSLAANNWLGYDLNRYNDSQALATDARQAAVLLAPQDALLVSDDQLYFSNELSVLDVALRKAPYFVTLETLCEDLGPFGELVPIQPPKYWTEKPVQTIPAVSEVVFASHAFNRFVLASGATDLSTANGTYGIVTLGADRHLFHSALAGIAYDGHPTSLAALYVYDPALLAKGQVTVYLQVHSAEVSTLLLGDGTTTMTYPLDVGSDWIVGTFPADVAKGVLKVSISIKSGDPTVLTYQVK